MYDYDAASIGTADQSILNETFNVGRNLKPIKYKTKTDSKPNKKQKKSVRSEPFNYQQVNNGSIGGQRSINNSMSSMNNQHAKTKLPQPKNKTGLLKPVKVAGVPIDRSTASNTPQNRYNKKHPLSIPNYGKADFSITGQG